MRVLRNPALLAQRALLTAAAFPAQHIRSALSFMRRFGGAPPATARASAVRRAIQPRLRSGALGRNTSRRAAQAQSRRLARPAVCACSASCRRLPAMLRANEALMVVRESIPCQGSAKHRNGSEIGVSEKPRRYSAPSKVRSTGMAHLSGASGDACAAREMACTDSAQVEGRRRAGPERNPPPAHGRRREAALQGDGRYPDQAMQAAFADGCSARDQRRLRGGGARRSPATQSRPCQRWRITRPPAERP